MDQDPFGKLTDWEQVLDTLHVFGNNGHLSKCQPGLIRILRYKANWRLREEVLKRIGSIRTPSNDLIFQVLDILDDDNVYYDVRILAGRALIQLLKNVEDAGGGEVYARTQKTIEKLERIPQPPLFVHALSRLSEELGMPGS